VSQPIHLTSADNPRVKAMLRLRRQRERQRSGLFIAEGVREVSRALGAGLGPRELFWCADLLDRGVDGMDGMDGIDGVEGGGSLIDRWPGGLIFTVTAPLMGKLAYRQNPEGILGVFEQPQFRLADMACETGCGPERGAGLWLVAVGTQKPGNLGAMVRSAEAAGCTGVFVCGGVVDAFNPNAIRASTGAVFELPVVAASANEVLALLRDWGVRVFIATPDAATVYTDVDLTGPAALVIGPEDAGFDADVLSDMGKAGVTQDVAGIVGGGDDRRGSQGPWQDPQGWVCRVSIPMLGHTADSLNASIAASVLLFEAVRQRRVGRS